MAEPIGFVQALPEKTPEEAALGILLYLEDCRKIDAVPRTDKVSDMVRRAVPTWQTF